MNNEKIGVAILGIGHMGATHVYAAKNSEYVEKVIGYEPNEERARLRGNELECQATSSLDDILGDPSIRLVCIAASNDVHCSLACSAMRAGKAVLCEKPMGVSLEEAQAMLAVQEETGAFLQIGFELHYSCAFMRAKEWIDKGLVGKVLNTHCDYFCHEFHRKGSWRSESEATLIGEKLSHYLDLPRWWTGMKVKDVYSVTAPNFVSYFNHPDNHQITYTFEGGAVSTICFIMGVAQSEVGDPLVKQNQEKADNGHRLNYMIYGTRGAIEIDVFRRRIQRWEFSDSQEAMQSNLVETVTYPALKSSLWHHNVYGQNLKVIELVAKGLPPENPAIDSYQTMRLCFAAEQSEKEHRVVQISELKPESIASLS